MDRLSPRCVRGGGKREMLGGKATDMSPVAQCMTSV